ncbi:hypothetical protein RMCBS344292_08711 [Rhizopus microsporus]|nr:hypothetical protein RMCBS344292_08711 [Rhizopus microsporus]
MQCEQQVTAEPVVADVKKEEQHDTPIKPEEQTIVSLQQEQPMVPLQQQQQPLQTNLVTTEVPVSAPDASTTTTATTATELIPPESTISTITTFEEIQKQLKSTLDHIEQRNMVSGFQTLSKATAAVVEHCEQLGLTSDDHPYNAIDREQFWAGLNNCWLYALAQRQEPSSDTERLTDQHLYNLRDMVVAWADKLERGL